MQNKESKAPTYYNVDTRNHSLSRGDNLMSNRPWANGFCALCVPSLGSPMGKGQENFLADGSALSLCHIHQAASAQKIKEHCLSPGEQGSQNEVEWERLAEYSQYENTRH